MRKAARSQTNWAGRCCSSSQQPMQRLLACQRLLDRVPKASELLADRGYGADGFRNIPQGNRRKERPDMTKSSTGNAT